MKKILFYITEKIFISQYIIICLLLYIIIYKNKYILNKKIILKCLQGNAFKTNLFIDKKKLDYDNNNFAIIKVNCKVCGLFFFYNHYLGCIISFIKKGYIPIVDLVSFPNIFNSFNNNSLNKNPWELYFSQPYGYTLEGVKKNSKNIQYFNCIKYQKPYKYNIYINKILMDFWHTMAYKYIPIKKEIIKESNIIKKNLFTNSINILGVLIRGTDYIASKPKKHCIPPSLKVAIRDIKKMNKKYKYDLIFLTTEDDIIRNKFINEFGDKLRFLKPKKNLKYNYKKKVWLAFNKNVKGNLYLMKIYLIV